MGAFMSKDDTTGSIKPLASPWSSDLDASDWRIAEPALAQALLHAEPQAPAAWSNPASERSGAFQPVGRAFLRDGRTCRAFVARINVGEASKLLQAIGCQGDAGAVAIDQAEAWKGI
jgi:hypothetical protein